MRKFLFLSTLLLSSLVYSQDLQYDGFVNDFADILTDEQEQKLNSQLVAFEKETEIEFTIITVNSLNGEEISSFANDLFRKWGVGKADKNNGLMLLIAPNERKYRTEVGYGLEEYLTDGYTEVETADNFQDNFKAGKYYEGISIVADHYMDRMGKMSWPEREKDKERMQEENAAAWATFGYFLMWVAIIIVAFFIGRSVARHLRVRREEEQRELEEQEREEKRKKQELQSQINRLIKIVDNFRQQFSYPDSQKHPSINEWRNLMVTISQLVVDFKGNIEEAHALESKITSLVENPTRILTAFREDLKSRAVIRGFIESGFKTQFNTAKRAIDGFNRHRDNLIKANDPYFPAGLPDSIINREFDQADSHFRYLVEREESQSVEKLMDIYYSCTEAINNVHKNINSTLSVSDSLNQAKDYLQSVPYQITHNIKEARDTCKSEDVGRRSLESLKAAEEELSKFIPSFEREKVMDSQSQLRRIFEKVSRIRSEIASEVSENHARIRRQRQDEIDEERRRKNHNSHSSGFSSSSSYSSSSSSDSSSSYSDSGSSFGGGDSGGGGSDGGW